MDAAQRKELEADIAAQLANQPEDTQEAELQDDVGAELTGDEGKDATLPDSGLAEKPAGVLRQKLSSIYDLDEDVEEEELADALLERLQQLEKSHKEAEARAAEAAAKLAERQQEAEKAKVEIPKPQEQEQTKKIRKLAPLKAPDPDLQNLVEYDNELKQFVGKDKFGSAGAAAAKELNDYKKQRDQRFEMWVNEDPTQLILDEAREEIERIAEARAQAILDKIKAEQQTATQATEAEKSQAEFAGFMETVKEKLYKLGPDGQPKKNPITGEIVTTVAGAEFIREFNELAEMNPNVSPAALAKKAYSTVERLTAVQPKTDPKQETADKKKRFLTTQRKHESGVAANANVATTQDKINSGVRMSLLQALLEDPDNEDNPDLAQLRK